MSSYLQAFQHVDAIIAYEKVGTIFLPDTIFIVQLSVCSSGIGLQHSTGMGSYLQPLLEIYILSCGTFIVKEHMVVVTRNGKEFEGFHVHSYPGK